MNKETVSKSVRYLNASSYITMNTLSSKTEYVWIAFHGMGYLSKYFSKYFSGLHAERNYIICPQAPSKYYLKDNFKHVGASWLTKEETAESLSNLYAYLDALWQNENIPSTVKLIVFGYSQGVSIAIRWVAHRKIQCEKLVLYAGSIPKELLVSDFNHFHKHTSIHYIFGNSDPYITPAVIRNERTKLEMLFGDKTKELEFNGGHEVKTDIIENIIPK